MLKDYTVVIPAYACPEELRRCIEDISEVTPDKYLPNRVLVVDDASPNSEIEFAASYLTTSRLKVDYIRSDNQVGFISAAIKGFPQVDTELTVLMHADTRLSGKPMKYLNPITKTAVEDPLGVIITQLSGTEDEVVACAPFSVWESKPHKIYGGFRVLSHNDAPCSALTDRFYEPARQVKHYRWWSVASLDTVCVAIRTETLADFPLNPECGHFFAFDDWCCQVRAAGKYVYVTSNTVVRHPKKPEKPEGSLSIPSENSYTIPLVKFQEKWLDSTMWEHNAPRQITKTEGITK